MKSKKTMFKLTGDRFISQLQDLYLVLTLRCSNKLQVTETNNIVTKWAPGLEVNICPNSLPKLENLLASTSHHYMLR